MPLDATTALVEIVGALDTAIGQDGPLTLTAPLLSALREAQVVSRRLSTENLTMGRRTPLGPRKSLFLGNPDDVTLVGKDTQDGPEHPLYDPRVLEKPDPLMVANIKRVGVKKAVLVRRVDEEIQIVDGRRRIINAREANIELHDEGKEEIRVPMMLEKGKDEDLFETMVLANCFTKQPSPIENARLLERYLAFEGKSDADAAEIFGVTTRTIANWKDMLKLDPQVQQAVHQQWLSATAATKLVSLEPQQQQAALKELEATKKAGKRVTVTQAAKQANRASDTQNAPPKRVVRKLLALDPDDLWNAGLEEEFLKGVRWVLGDLPSEKVKGMKKLLRKAEKT